MRCTELEAQEKLCKIQPAGVVPQNQISGGQIMAYAFAKCAGSGCCHWRWCASSVIDVRPNPDPPKGYCGLAGIPTSDQ